MLGFLVRLLPFWVREPLVILVGTVFGVRILHMALVDGEGWVPAVIGAVFLLGAALRVRVVVHALRARRRPAPPADEVAEPAPPAPVVPAPVVRRPVEKKPNAFAQTFFAIALFAVIGGALWIEGKLPEDGTAATGASRPAACRLDEDEKPPSAYRNTPEAVTGADLCRALNRPELPELLGTPTERSVYASGTDNTAPLTDRKVAQPEARVEFETYTVELSATYNKLTVDQYQALTAYRDDADLRKLTVLGRPALLTSDHMMKIQFDPGSGEGASAPVEQGPLARTLTVALDGKDRGGSYDLTVWSESGLLVDDSALVDIAEAVLPAITQGTRDQG
ncbi:DUF6215 domain-containing protein [Streptomyces althioticus]|uniref:DUF6215 domain-containing protein n=1 Tax=Streptomyces althioticus TaxID=83380 RepID=UPI00340582D9